MSVIFSFNKKKNKMFIKTCSKCRKTFDQTPTLKEILGLCPSCAKILGVGIDK